MECVFLFLWCLLYRVIWWFSYLYCVFYEEVSKKQLCLGLSNVQQ